MIKGLQGPHATYINLQYADDTFTFGTDNIESAVVMKWLLCCFKVWSGLKISFHKSSLVLMGQRTTHLVFIIQIFSCAVTTFPIKFLRLLLQIGRLTRQDWAHILESLERKLEGWKGKLLFAWGGWGGITLLNSVLTTTPLYHMFFFVLPKWVRERIDRVRSQFIWSGTTEAGLQYHLVS